MIINPSTGNADDNESLLYANTLLILCGILLESKGILMDVINNRAADYFSRNNITIQSFLESDRFFGIIHVEDTSDENARIAVQTWQCVPQGMEEPMGITDRRESSV